MAKTKLAGAPLLVTTVTQQIVNDTPVYDMVVIGGGINGVAIARDAAGRGLSVLLVEKHDFAGATSSASSKLIHGGLRYLEQYEFRLVRESLSERETVLNMAPHITWPLEFIMPHVPSLRPRWMIRTGLYLYDNLGSKMQLAKSKSVLVADSMYGTSLKPIFKHAFSYSDVWVDDARLVLLSAKSAEEQGAVLLPRVGLDSAQRTQIMFSGDETPVWHITLSPSEGHPNPDVVPKQIYGKILINATGPWAGYLSERLLAENKAPSENQKPNTGKKTNTDEAIKLRLVQGSHMVVPRRYEGNHAYILQNEDRRIIFMLPYERDYTLIGTTDTPLEAQDMSTFKPQMHDHEVEYLCKAVNMYLANPVTAKDIIWRYSGVRPLLDDGEAQAATVSRDYELILDGSQIHAPLLTVIGGKITTHRRLAEHALAKLGKLFTRQHPLNQEPWTKTAYLPGGNISGGWQNFEVWQNKFLSSFRKLDQQWLKQLTRRHGTLAAQILENVDTMEDLGRHFGGGLYEKEVRYFKDHEWSYRVEDVLWRRTKCGLHMSANERAIFEEHFDLI